jgi:hypothetical protein
MAAATGRGGAGRLGGLPEDAHAMDMSSVKPVLEARRGGRTRTPDAQCWKLPFWPLNYAPIAIQMKTARQGLPCGRFPVTDLRYYPGTIPMRRAAFCEHG